MTKLYPLLIACSVVLFYSCKTASKSYKKGDYTEAIELGVKTLQKDQSDYETRDLIQQSYNYSVSQHEDEIRILSNSKNDNRFESIWVHYMELQHLYKTIQQYPAVARLIKTKDYSEYVTTYGDKAAEVHIEKAGRWMAEGTKISYREGYKEFNKALQFKPYDDELRRQRDTAYDLAITKVIISPIQSFGGGYSYSSSRQMQDFQRDIIRTLSNNMNNSFVKFYNEFDARNENIEADQVMDLNLSRISVGQPNDNKSSKEVSREVVIREIVYKPDSVVKQYGTVKAKIITTKRNLISQGDLNITLRDTRGRTIWNDHFTGEHKWETEFVSFTGDERALSEEDKKLVNQENITPPTEETITHELFRQIQNDLMQRLRNYYTRY